VGAASSAGAGDVSGDGIAGIFALMLSSFWPSGLGTTVHYPWW
jgi:hypothetical protein